MDQDGVRVQRRAVRTVCPHDCPDQCSILATVEDGRVVGVRGDPDHLFTGGFLCAKVNRYPERVHSPERLLTPLRRTGPKGSGQFAPVSWETALDEIAARWMEARFPLWGRDTGAAAREFLRAGFRVVVVCGGQPRLDASWAGREFDKAFLEALPAGVDLCGENSEFHTFAYDGPVLRRPVAFRRGAVVERDGFAFADLLDEPPEQGYGAPRGMRIAHEWLGGLGLPEAPSRVVTRSTYAVPPLETRPGETTGADE